MPPAGGGYRGGNTAGRDPRPVPAQLGWIGEAWGMLSSDFGGWLTLMVPFIAAYIAIIIISAISGGLLSIVSLALAPVLASTCGALLLKARTGQNTEFGAVFQGAMSMLVPGIVFSIISSIAVSCGMMLCFVPGIFMVTALYMGLFQIGDGDTDFMKPLTRGIEVAKADMGGYLLFTFVCIILSSFVLPIPVVLMAYMLAYRANYE